MGMTDASDKPKKKQRCSKCKGKGEIDGKTCKYCKGKGWTR